jgi:hypothetical protein
MAIATKEIQIVFPVFQRFLRELCCLAAIFWRKKCFFYFSTQGKTMNREGRLWSFEMKIVSDFSTLLIQSLLKTTLFCFIPQ